MKNHLLLILFLSFINAFEYSVAQEFSADITVGKQFKIYSEIIGEERDILISLPFGYDSSNKEYPVIYKMDGSTGGLIVTDGLLKYLSFDSIPEMICAMIPNTDRGRDLSIFPMDQLPTSGGAGNFLKFIAEELIPYIDENYR
ncbi:alpha/beta hydrolase-fold protein, partial [Bacteroidota bacterium]